MIHGSPDLSWTQVPFWIGHILQDAETVNLFDVPGTKIQEKIRANLNLTNGFKGFTENKGFKHLNDGGDEQAW